MKFHRDGNEFDYIATKNETTFGLSHEFGVWYVWINDKEQGFFDTFADAKEFCKNYKG